jgi:hypothetical protein
MYFKIGQYDKCYNIWKTYSENISKSFDPSPKKVQIIQDFYDKYMVICNSLNQFKKNIIQFKNFCIPEDDNIALYKKKNRFDNNYESASDLMNFLIDFDKIHAFTPNIESNFIEFYEYQRALIHFYIDS